MPTFFSFFFFCVRERGGFEIGLFGLVFFNLLFSLSSAV